MNIGTLTVFVNYQQLCSSLTPTVGSTGEWHAFMPSLMDSRKVDAKPGR